MDEVLFYHRIPDILVVDDFFVNPDAVRRFALEKVYGEDIAYFKGQRSLSAHRWPFLREEFSWLLGAPITNWDDYGANGVFQKTTHADPLVYHHDTQSYAGAIYLTPDAPLNSGTSFWRDRVYGCRHQPAREAHRLGPQLLKAEASVYDEHNLVHPDNWELVDSVANVYNRLVLWNARLIHSASSYEGFDATEPRLVQLFFFD